MKEQDSRDNYWPGHWEKSLALFFLPTRYKKAVSEM